MRRSAGLGVSSLLLAACSVTPNGATTSEPVATESAALECGGQCQAICIYGCNGGYHYSWQQAQCVSDDIGCDDGYSCQFGPCGGAGERVCNTAGTGCWSCNNGMHYDATTALCQPPVPAGTCDDGFYYEYGPCGGAGQRECDLASGCSACNPGFFFDGGGPCHDGLCLEVTERCQPSPPPGANVAPHTDLTFFVANDIHLFRGWGDVAYQSNVWVMNNVDQAFPGGWPADTLSAGSPIASPAGVVVAGDITTCGDCAATTVSSNEILPFRDLYDQGRTANSIDYPVYLGLGNHDYYPNYSYNVSNGSSTSQKNDLMIAYQQSRMEGQQGVTSYDENSQSYSWDWGNVHFVQANLFPGVYNGGLSWLQQDLADNVGASGRPVVVIQHFGWDNFSKEMTDNAGNTPTYDTLAANYNCVTDGAGEIISCTDANGLALNWTWWSYADRAAENLTLAGYNVVAIFTGHLHNSPAYVHVPNNADNAPGPGYDVYRGSSGGDFADAADDTNAGGFLVVHMNDEGMDVMHLGWSYGPNSPWGGAPPPGVPSQHWLTETRLWSKRYAPLSCADYLSQHPGTPSGMQTIDPDGPGGNPPMLAYCDMTTDGGGWTLITSTDGVSTWSQASSVTEGSATYLPSGVVQQLAARSSQVHIRSASVDPASQSTPYHYITSMPGSQPITNLYYLLTLNANVLTPSEVWTGDAQVIANQLWYTCAEPPYVSSVSYYPTLYWACNNVNGLHVLPSVSTWAWDTPSEPMDVFVR